MIRLPPTGIAISQHELNTQLQRLDFHSGLLKQGFKKHEIVRYLRDREAKAEDPDFSSTALEQGPSTYDLLSRSHSTGSISRRSSSDCSTLDDIQQQFASPIQPPGRHGEAVPKDSPCTRKVSSSLDFVPQKQYAPRQSSLLRFARGVSPDASDEDQQTRATFSHRSNIAYRPRSETYSYDQSEIDEEDLIPKHTAATDDLHNLSLDDSPVISTQSTKSTSRTVSSLRPDAEPFTPAVTRPSHVPGASQNNVTSPVNNSNSQSMPSSPPMTQTSAGIDHGSSVSLSLPRTPLTLPGRIHDAADRGSSQQQFFDGSFTVYDDSIPARFQPQTPAELHRGAYANEYNAAYTAPPGMVRSSAARQGMDGDRHGSADISPTASATIIRDRRQREFLRGLRVEGLRINRLRGDTRQPRTHSTNEVDALELWRDDLDADGVGEENFEDP